MSENAKHNGAPKIKPRFGQVRRPGEGHPLSQTESWHRPFLVRTLPPAIHITPERVFALRSMEGGGYGRKVSRVGRELGELAGPATITRRDRGCAGSITCRRTPTANLLRRMGNVRLPLWGRELRRRRLPTSAPLAKSDGRVSAASGLRLSAILDPHRCGLTLCGETQRSHDRRICHLRGPALRACWPASSSE